MIYYNTLQSLFLLSKYKNENILTSLVGLRDRLLHCHRDRQQENKVYRSKALTQVKDYKKVDILLPSTVTNAQKHQCSKMFPLQIT